MFNFYFVAKLFSCYAKTWHNVKKIIRMQCFGMTDADICKRLY